MAQRRTLALVPPAQRTKARDVPLEAPQRAPAGLPVPMPLAQITSTFADIRNVLAPLAAVQAGQVAVGGLIPPRPDHGRLDALAAQGVAAAYAVATAPTTPPEIQVAATREITAQMGIVAAAHERQEQRRERRTHKLVSAAVGIMVAGGLGIALWKGR